MPSATEIATFLNDHPEPITDREREAWAATERDPWAVFRDLVRDYGDDAGYDVEQAWLGRLASLIASGLSPLAAAQALWGTP